MPAHRSRAPSLPFRALLVAALLVGAPDAQGNGPRPSPSAAPAPAREPIVLEGEVWADGAPASGVLVVTDQGGRTVSGADGRFRLALALEPRTRELGVTAVLGSGGSARVASARVQRTSAARIRVPPLELGQGGCAPAWLPTFGGTPGPDGEVKALAVFDEGTGAGPVLFVGGDFRFAGGVAADFIARWDGRRWSSVGGGVAAPVHALTVFDDGRGPALYAGGVFQLAGGRPANRVARWDGTAWSALGGGANGFVRALASLGDGPAARLCAGGDFTLAGGRPANRVAAWDGARWEPLGDGMDDRVLALAAFKEETGLALYAGGEFRNASGVAASRIARWDGSAWAPLAGGIDAFRVHALTPFEDRPGAGPALFVGGEFRNAGNVPARNLARWDGVRWSAPGDPDGAVRALAVFDDGAGPALFVGGDFTHVAGTEANRIARWNGARWDALAGGLSRDIDAGVQSLCLHDDPTRGGPALIAGGRFSDASGVPVLRVSAWNGRDWAPLGGGLDGAVLAAAVHDDGAGPGVVVGGQFRRAGSRRVDRIARWDGTDWQALGSGVDETVLALATLEDDGGAVVFAGGGFTHAGGIEAARVARWDGAVWSALGSGTDGIVRALETFDDGGGAALFAGGDFALAGGSAAERIARWDGAGWSALGTGLGGGPLRRAESLAVFDDGRGPALYVGGFFTTAGGVAVNHVARWNGAGWSALAGGMSGGTTPRVLALEVFDDGHGPALYAGGSFTAAGGTPASQLARWDGVRWQALGGGLLGGEREVRALAVLDDGGGPALYAGGSFTQVDGQPLLDLARWDGTSWSGVGGEVLHTVSCLVALDRPGPGPALFAGGGFVGTSVGDGYLARWQGCH